MLRWYVIDHRACHMSGLTPQFDQDLAITVVYVVREGPRSQHICKDRLEVCYPGKRGGGSGICGQDNLMGWKFVGRYLETR